MQTKMLSDTHKHSRTLKWPDLLVKVLELWILTTFTS